MNRLLLRASLRHLGRHPVLTLLSMGGIALGVAVVVAIDLATASAQKAFTLSNESVTGRTTHEVLAGPSGLDEALYVRLRVELGVDAAPVVLGYATSPLIAGRSLSVLGIDPFAEAPFRPYLGRVGTGDLTPFLTVQNAVFLSQALALRLGIGRGAALPVVVNGVAHELVVAGLIDAGATGAARALDDVLITDISTAQDVFDERGKLSRIDLIVPDSPAGADELARIERACQGACSVVPAEARSTSVSQMTRAFTLNLSAMSLLSLLVGMFLIYNTMTFSVVQRRPLLGTLRALGVTRREIFTLWVCEALFLALPATAIRLTLGVFLSTGLVRLVTQTINDLYFAVNVRQVSVEFASLAKGVLLGVGATVLAALAPAWEATRVVPTLTLRRSSYESRLIERSPGLALVGLSMIACAALLLAASGKGLLLAYAGLFLVIVGAALGTPLAIRIFAALAGPVASRIFGLIGRMAARGIVTSLTRTSVALAALMVAVSTTVGIGIMVQSFRHTVIEWLEGELQSDVFIGPPSLVSRKGDGTLSQGVIARVRATSGVAAVNTIRNRRVRTATGDVDMHVPSYGGAVPSSKRFRERDVGDVFAVLDREDAIGISEPYAFHRGLALGSWVRMATDHGEVPFRVVGIYTDYASDEGGIVMTRPTYERHFDDRGISAIGVVAGPGVDLESLRDRLRQNAGQEQALTIHANREIREMSIAIFDRTFAITQVFRALSVGVAFLGIVSALMALALERARELAVLRAVGVTPRQLGLLVTVQTTLMGICAGFLSLPLGAALSLVLVYVINKRSFGWTLQVEFSPFILVEAMALSLVAALLGAIYPAWKMARVSPQAALREP